MSQPAPPPPRRAPSGPPPPTSAPPAPAASSNVASPTANNNNNNSTRSGVASPTSGGAAGGVSSSRSLSTVKVRNVQSSLMYHLMFDGDIGALTGAQLRQHVEGVSGIPAEKQVLSLNGRTVGSMTTGADIDLRNGSTLMLEVVGANANPSNNNGGRANNNTVNASSSVPASPIARGAGGGVNESRASLPPANNNDDDDPRYYQQQQPQQRQQQSSYYARDSPSGMNRSSATAPGAYRRPLGSGYHPADEMPPLPPHHSHHHGNASLRHHLSSDRYAGSGAAPPPPPYRGGYGEADDLDVVVDIVEESDAPAAVPEVGPGFMAGDQVAVAQFRRTAADVEEMRLQQQEYIWKLEQVRFETERMNREREMKRQLMELEYEATLLDRDRVELERHTAMEKQKLGHVAAQNRLEMDILQKFFPGASALTKVKRGKE